MRNWNRKISPPSVGDYDHHNIHKEDNDDNNYDQDNYDDDHGNYNDDHDNNDLD